jgi:hypothetical protein
MATLSITEFDAYGNVLGTQTVPITTPFAVQTWSPIPSGRQPYPGGQISAPFHAQCVTLLLVPVPDSSEFPQPQAIITFGASPKSVANGIVVSGPMTLSPWGACLAVL